MEHKAIPIRTDAPWHINRIEMEDLLTLEPTDPPCTTFAQLQIAVYCFLDDHNLLTFPEYDGEPWQHRALRQALWCKVQRKSIHLHCPQSFCDHVPVLFNMPAFTDDGTASLLPCMKGLYYVNHTKWCLTKKKQNEISTTSLSKMQVQILFVDWSTEVIVIKLVDIFLIIFSNNPYHDTGDNC